MAVINTYIFASSVLYAPTTDNQDYQRREVEHRAVESGSAREHDHDQIMSKFYEQELPEMPSMRDETIPNEETNNTSRSEKEPQDTKKSSAEKKQEEIWKSIQNTVEDDESSSSDDEVN